MVVSFDETCPLFKIDHSSVVDYKYKSKHDMATLVKDMQKI